MTAETIAGVACVVPSIGMPGSPQGAGINYYSLEAMQAMKGLHELENLSPPSN